MRLAFPSAALGAVCSLMEPACAQDWPQWLGPTGDAVLRETELLTSFPDEPLPVLWRAKIEAGFSGPSVSENRVFVTDFVREAGSVTNRASVSEQVAGHERVLCLDVKTGEELWVHRYSVSYAVSYPSGPRTSPLVHKSKVYTLGTDGHLFCLAVDTGKVVWSKHFKADYGADTPFWGHSAHPILVEDTIVCMVGAKKAVVVAFDLETGKERWRALEAAEPGYAPPSLATLSGEPTLLVWHPESLNSLDPKTGELRWSIPLAARAGMSVTAPLVVGSNIYVSGIGTRPTLVRVAEDGRSASIVWRGGPRKGIVTANSSPLVHKGILYGVDTQGRLIASSFATGEQLWSTYRATTGKRGRSYSTAFLVRHGDLFFVYNEHGELILAELSEDGFTELGRSKILEPTTNTYGRAVVWSHPAFAQQSVFVRNDKEVVRVSLRSE